MVPSDRQYLTCCNSPISGLKVSCHWQSVPQRRVALADVPWCFQGPVAGCLCVNGRTLKFEGEFRIPQRVEIYWSSKPKLFSAETPRVLTLIFHLFFLHRCLLAQGRGKPHHEAPLLLAAWLSSWAQRDDVFSFLACKPWRNSSAKSLRRWKACRKKKINKVNSQHYAKRCLFCLHEKESETIPDTRILTPKTVKKICLVRSYSLGS